MEALVYDVHGNLPALEAVLNDSQGVDRFVLGGDYALFGGWPKETVERLRTLHDALWIRGNGERWTARPEDAPDNPVALGCPGRFLAGHRRAARAARKWPDVAVGLVLAFGAGALISAVSCDLAQEGVKAGRPEALGPRSGSGLRPRQARKCLKIASRIF